MSDYEDTPKNTENNLTPKKKRLLRNELTVDEIAKHRKQQYRHEWETDSKFKGWLKPEKNDKFRARCLPCQVSFVSELSSIKKHSISNSHKNALKSCSVSSQSLMSKFTAVQKIDPLEKQVKNAEIKLSAMLAEHNVAFLFIDHLEQVLKEIFPDSLILQKVKLRRTKATNIIKNVIAPAEKETISKQLNSVKFSILIDESIDIACQSTMCVVVRYYDTDSKIIVSRFWDLIQVYNMKDPDQIDKGATAQNLFTKCIESFEKYNVNTKNIVGFASDGCSTMMGSNNSVASRMKAMFPDIFIMKCICHSLHLCCSEASKKLPRRCEDLARNIFNFFSHSSKRQSQYIQFQQFLQVDIHKLLNPSQTRWLSLFAVIQRVIEQWDALKLYFSEKCLSEKLMSAENIYFQLNDPFTKTYFYFLEWVLPKFTALNQYFQSENVVLNILNEKMEMVYKELLLCYMRRDYVMNTPLNVINPADETQFLNSTNIYLGVKVQTQIKTPAVQKRNDLLNEFYSRCIDFLKSSCLQIKKRYDFSNTVLPMLNMLTPSVVLSSHMRDKYPSITCLTQQLPRMIREEVIQKIDDQWRNIVLVKLTDEILNEKQPDKFWILIKELESGQFLDIAEFALSILSLPHSNASCERVFSKINCIKTKSRNKLVTSTVSATVIVSECVKKAKGNCINFQPTKLMFDNMTYTSLYSTVKSNTNTN